MGSILYDEKLDKRLSSYLPERAWMYSSNLSFSSISSQVQTEDWINPKCSMSKYKAISSLITNRIKFIHCWYIFMIKYSFSITKIRRGFPRGLMVKAMDCGIVVSATGVRTRYYVHFRANTLGKGMNPHILPAMG